MFKLFVEGGPVYMSVLTALLVAIFFAAWKAPRWVKEIGAFAMGFGFLSLLFGLRNIFTVLQNVAAQFDDVSSIYDLVSPGVLFGGWKVAMIPVIYGVIIYLISLIDCIIQKPRL
jgi:hypothetical protein